MKKQGPKILFTLILALLSSLSMSAQLGLSVTVKVDEAGTLFVKLQEKIEETGELSDITSLTVSGEFNDDDKLVLCNQLTNLVSANFSGLSEEGAKWLSFENLKHLKSCVLPTSATELRSGVFCRCDSITSITMPKGLVAIPSYFAQYCYQLKQITIPESVTSIGDYAFDECSSLSAITLPASLEKLGHRAFYCCI